MNDLPTGWRIASIGEACTVVTDGTHFSPKTVTSGIPYVTVRDVTARTIHFDRAARVAEPDFVQLEANGCRPLKGDVLFSKDGTVGRTARVRDDRPFVVLSSLAILRPDREVVLPEYLELALSSPDFQGQALGAKTGTAIRRVVLRNLKKATIPIPPLDEQRRIVPLVEDHLSRLDAADASVSRSLRRLIALRDAALYQAIEHAKSMPDVGVVTIADIAKVSSGLTPLKGNKSFYEGGTIPWITSGDLHQGVIEQATQFVTQAALDQTTLKLVPAGALLVAMYGEGRTRGTAAELAIDATTNQACAAIVLHNQEIRPWIRLVLDANYTKLRRLAAGGVQPNLNLSIVRAIEVPMPGSEVRAELLQRRVELVDANNRIRGELLAAQRRSARLRRSLLSAAFAGRLTAASDFSDVEAMIPA